MNLKKLLYFIVSLLIIGSLSAYFISREMSDDEVIISGEYDIWVSETEDVTKPSEIMVATKNTVTTQIITQMILSTKVPETTSVETAVIPYLMLNINTALKEELMLLDGIGEITAQKIIDYRNSYGGYRNIEEILNVNGIGEKTFSGIRNHIYVENPVYPEDSFEEIQIPEENIIEEVPLQIPVEQPVNNENPTEAAPNPVQSPTEATEMKFDLNKVTASELEIIPGIDSETAENIIALRTSIKYFSNTYELLYVKGMTEQKLQNIIIYFYVLQSAN